MIKCLNCEFWGKNKKSMSNHLRENPKGRIFSLEHRKNLSKAHVGMKGRRHSEEAKAKIGASQSGEKSVWYGKKHAPETIAKMRGRVVSESTKEKLRKARMKQRIPQSETKIEKLVEAELRVKGFEFSKQVPLCDIAIVDFYIPSTKTVIQCDGDYWHSLPDRIIKDKRQTETLTLNGYRVFRLKEKDIKKSPSDCINAIL